MKTHFARWRCESCGWELELPPNEQPPMWRGFFVMEPPESAEYGERIHLCGNCSDRTEAAMAIGGAS